jgi:hypothetical protein
VFSSFFNLVRFASVQLTSSPPFSLPGRLWPTSSCRRVVSWFLSIESRRARYLHFNFRQRFVPPHPLSRRSWSIESTPPPHAILSEPFDSRPLRTIRLPSFTDIKRLSQSLPLFPSRLHFASALTRALHHRSSTRRRHSLTTVLHPSFICTTTQSVTN